MPHDWRFRGYRDLDAAVARFEELLREQGASDAHISVQAARMRRSHNNLAYAMLVNVERPPGFYTRRDPRESHRHVRRSVDLAEECYVIYELLDEDKPIGTVRFLDAGPTPRPVT